MFVLRMQLTRPVASQVTTYSSTLTRSAGLLFCRAREVVCPAARILPVITVPLPSCRWEYFKWYNHHQLYQENG